MEDLWKFFQSNPIYLSRRIPRRIPEKKLEELQKKNLGSYIPKRSMEDFQKKYIKEFLKEYLDHFLKEQSRKIVKVAEVEILENIFLGNLWTNF